MVNLDEYSSENIGSIRNILSHKELKWLKGAKHKSLDIWSKFPYFKNVEIVEFILDRLNEDILTLDKPYHILKKVIGTITGLCKVGDVPRKNSIQNKEVETLTRSKGINNLHN